MSPRPPWTEDVLLGRRTPACLCLEPSGQPGPGNTELLGERDRGTMGPWDRRDPGSAGLFKRLFDRSGQTRLQTASLPFAFFDGLGFISVC